MLAKGRIDGFAGSHLLRVSLRNLLRVKLIHLQIPGVAALAEVLAALALARDCALAALARCQSAQQHAIFAAGSFADVRVHTRRHSSVGQRREGLSIPRFFSLPLATEEEGGEQKALPVSYKEQNALTCD